MKKAGLVIFLIALILCACSKDAKFLRDAELFLKTQLDDPDSYQKESIEITKKVTQLENEKYEIHNGLYVNKRVRRNLNRKVSDLNESFNNEILPLSKYSDRAAVHKAKDLYKEGVGQHNFKIKYFEGKIDSLSKVITQLERDSISVFKKIDDLQIQRIGFKAVYKAKNKSGVLVKQTAYLIWYPGKGFKLVSRNK